jgi:FG-GAP-like repeat
MRKRIALVMSAAFVVLVLNSCGDVSGIFSGLADNSLPPMTLSWSARADDLNGDGKIEILESFVTTQSNGPDLGWVNVYLQSASGGGNFAAPTKYSVLAPDPMHMVVGDLNNDGRPDVITVNALIGTNTSPSSSVLMQDDRNPGSLLGTFKLDTTTEAEYAAIGDLNHDGRNDIAVAGVSDVILFTQSPTAPGTFTRSPLGMGFADSVAIADLDHDGYNDLIFTDAKVVSVRLQNPNAPGTFLAARGYAADIRPALVSVADLNGDGHLDLVVLNMGDPNDGTTARVSILLQDPIVSGTFLPPVNYKASRGLNAVGVADLNGDGHPDLAVANGDGNVSVLLQDSSGRGTFLAATQYAANNHDGVEDISIADVNGDGFSDLVFAAGSNVNVRFQVPGVPGTFGPITAITK